MTAADPGNGGGQRAGGRRPQRSPVPAREGADQLPSFLIVGAMRSGTTTLSRVLGSHPDVFVARQKEVHFFDNHYDRGTDWYREQFRTATPGQLIGEATPHYMYHPAVAERMATTVPDVKLIAILRNPVDRAYSHYWHNYSRGKERLSFAEALDQEPARIAKDAFSSSSYSYVARGRYHGQLERILRYYARRSLLVILFDDLRASPLTTLDEVFSFLGVREGSLPPTTLPWVNSYTKFRSVAVRNSTRRLPTPVRNLIGHFNARRASYPPLDADTRHRLIEDFEADNMALEAWLGRDIPLWRS